MTANYFNSLKDILIKNDLVYAVEQKTMICSAPFGGYMPKICNDMLEDLCLDIVNHPRQIVKLPIDYIVEKDDMIRVKK